MQVFNRLAATVDDAHPDAHACRLKISLATMEAPMPSPWDLTTEAAKFINKVAHVSATTQIECVVSVVGAAPARPAASCVLSPRPYLLNPNAWVRTLWRGRV